MKLEITTTPNAVEKANYLLAQAIYQVEDRADLRLKFGLSPKDISDIKLLRKKMVNAFVKSLEK